jgi:hypothetical protein
MIEEVVAALRVSPPHHPNSMGVQFVQIGGDAKAAEALDKLAKLNHKVMHPTPVRVLDMVADNDLQGMVDTVLYAGPRSISGDKLGGLHPNVRALKTP